MIINVKNPKYQKSTAFYALRRILLPKISESSVITINKLRINRENTETPYPAKRKIF